MEYLITVTGVLLAGTLALRVLRCLAPREATGEATPPAGEAPAATAPRAEPLPMGSARTPVARRTGTLPPRSGRRAGTGEH